MNRGVSGAWRVAGFLIATALATTISGVAAAQSPAPNRSAASAGQSYWTPQRMAAAKTKGILASGAIKPTAAPLATGAPGAAGGSMPGERRSINCSCRYCSRRRGRPRLRTGRRCFPGSVHDLSICREVLDIPDLLVWRNRWSRTPSRRSPRRPAP
jgi:hypothetical protein